MTEKEKHHRQIRSYVLREGRLTAGQQKAFETVWPEFGIDFNKQLLDLPALFGNDQPTFIEIGFGNGESLAKMAEAHPQHNYLGIEVHRPGVGHLLIKIEELGLKNLRVIRHDAVEVLREGIADNALEGVFLFFPDPWHKKRHHKRRILQESFVHLLAQKIRPGGFFHAATDWENYAEHMMAEMSDASDLFENQSGTGNYTPKPDYRPLTKFEQRGQRLGHGVWDLIFTRH